MFGAKSKDNEELKFVLKLYRTERKRKKIKKMKILYSV